jgi:hypothetical protein
MFSNLTIAEPTKTCIEMPHHGVLMLKHLENIIEDFELCSYVSAGLVCKAWNIKITDMTSNVKKMICNPAIFGLWEWAKHMGLCKKITFSEVRNSMAILPSDILEIINAPCSVFQEKTVIKTHHCVYIPTSICGQDFHFVLLGKLIAPLVQKNTSSPEGYAWVPQACLKMMNTTTEKAHWVVMDNDFLGGDDTGPQGSRNKPFSIQMQMVKDLAKCTEKNYQVPEALEAVAVLVAHFLENGKTAFLGVLMSSSTFIDNRNVSVGEMDGYGIYLALNSDALVHKGVVPVLRFY